MNRWLAQEEQKRADIANTEQKVHWIYILKEQKAKRQTNNSNYIRTYQEMNVLLGGRENGHPEPETIVKSDQKVSKHEAKWDVIRRLPVWVSSPTLNDREFKPTKLTVVSNI